MDEDFISKKELLQKYGISYGALYRWKRLGLIPEPWFLRRATPTGQETFFRRRQICERVELILDSREHCSLEELARSLEENRRTTRSERKIIIKTPYAVHSFALDELAGAFIEDGGTRIEILDELKERKL